MQNVYYYDESINNDRFKYRNKKSLAGARDLNNELKKAAIRNRQNNDVAGSNFFRHAYGGRPFKFSTFAYITFGSIFIMAMLYVFVTRSNWPLLVLLIPYAYCRRNLSKFEIRVQNIENRLQFHEMRMASIGDRDIVCLDIPDVSSDYPQCAVTYDGYIDKTDLARSDGEWVPEDIEPRTRTSLLRDFMPDRHEGVILPNTFTLDHIDASGHLFYSVDPADLFTYLSGPIRPDEQIDPYVVGRIVHFLFSRRSIKRSITDLMIDMEPLQLAIPLETRRAHLILALSIYCKETSSIYRFFGPQAGCSTAVPAY